VFNPFTNISSIGSGQFTAGNSFSKEDPCVYPPTDAIDWYYGENINYYTKNYCTTSNRHWPTFQDISGILPPKKINPSSATNDNACLDSSSCHISRWTPELNTSYSGSILFLPPVPPPNDSLNETHIGEEQNRVLHGIPLIDNNIFKPEISDINTEISGFQHIDMPLFYPNPVSLENPKLIFSNISISEYSLKIFNLSGQEIDIKHIDASSIRLNHISKGVYIVQIIKDSSVYSIKFAVIE
jgi:hypothetical protein